MNKTLNVVPIVFCSSSTGGLYFAVAIKSLLENQSDSTYYDIYFLHDPDFPLHDQELISEMVDAEQNSDIHFVDMGDTYTKETENASATRWLKSVYYKLKIFEILPVHYNKAIYLDFDIAVTRDLHEMCSINLGDNCLASAASCFFNLHEEAHEQLVSIGVTNFSAIINDGVVLWNLDALRKIPNLSAYLSDLVTRNFKTVVQDLIHVAFNGKIQLIPLKYNYLVSYEDWYTQREGAIELYGQSFLDDAIKNPVIIHYAETSKPWRDLNVSFADVWWKYALMTPYEKDFLELRRKLRLRNLWSPIKRCVCYPIVKILSAFGLQTHFLEWIQRHRNNKLTRWTSF